MCCLSILVVLGVGLNSKENEELKIKIMLWQYEAVEKSKIHGKKDTRTLEELRQALADKIMSEAE